MDGTQDKDQGHDRESKMCRIESRLVGAILGPQSCHCGIHHLSLLSIVDTSLFGIDGLPRTPSNKDQEDQLGKKESQQGKEDYAAEEVAH